MQREIQIYIYKQINFIYGQHKWLIPRRSARLKKRFASTNPIAITNNFPLLINNATPTLHAIGNINDNNSQGDLPLTNKLSRTNKNFDDSIILNILQNNFRHLKNKFWKRVWIFTLKNQDMTSSNWWTIYFGFAEIYNSETFFILPALLKRPWCNDFD